MSILKHDIYVFLQVPNPPPSLEIVFESGNIRLVWTSPEETLFKTEEYKLEVSIDEWNTISVFSIQASALEYVINDFTMHATYRFKLFTVSHSMKSKPREIAKIASRKCSSNFKICCKYMKYITKNQTYVCFSFIIGIVHLKMRAN